MDMWRADKEQIKKIAEKKSLNKALEVHIPSGLYAWVFMADGSVVNVYEAELI
jgi:hypothetical protein